MKKILGSLVTIGVMGALVFGATSAFFSDTETSVDNRFEAGVIDLEIDNDSYAIDWNIPGFNNPQGNFVASTHTSWTQTDLTIEKFFDFVDLKPGDYGEDTISIHVGTNDAWLCAAAQVTEDHDNTYREPELEDDSTVDLGNPTTTDGELDESLNFAFWVDDGDNVFEDDETVFLDGPLSGLAGAGQMALADSTQSILGATEPIPGDTTFYIGKIWCFGELTEAAVPNNADTNPIDRGATGFNCDGSLVNNAAQSDVVVGDLEFYAEQSRNNSGFECSEWTPSFEGPQT
jgi:predicted ribosomally synthesized peptide with SipW-like signal peptide